MGNKLRIGVTCGDCNGIGLEVFLKAIAEYDAQQEAEWYLFVHPDTLRQTLQLLPLSIAAHQTASHLIVAQHKIAIVPVEPAAPVQFGVPTPQAARLAYNALQAAADWVERGQLDALVTLPVSKHSLAQVGFSAAGQTDWLAHRFQVSSYLMIFWSPQLVVALATIHIPLRQVATAISSALLHRQLQLLAATLRRDFAYAHPAIAVLGLNPHAGENGLLGAEEQEIIVPAIRMAQQDGIAVEGPFAADAFFGQQRYRQFTATLALYHDQGLIPLKLLAHGEAVNITAGLPFVRTSPDHGTAYDIAGKGIANPASCAAALRLVQQLVRNRQQA